ncbi:hypothetical protein C8J56DRAFT_907367 [Mycena floridula]|nr:hypothetical protein C8J56DRAFT_907367 [Mycena floridula]
MHAPTYLDPTLNNDNIEALMPQWPQVVYDVSVISILLYQMPNLAISATVDENWNMIYGWIDIIFTHFLPQHISCSDSTQHCAFQFIRYFVLVLHDAMPKNRSWAHHLGSFIMQLWNHEHSISLQTMEVDQALIKLDPHFRQSPYPPIQDTVIPDLIQVSTLLLQYGVDYSVGSTEELALRDLHFQTSVVVSNAVFNCVMTMLDNPEISLKYCPLVMKAVVNNLSQVVMAQQDHVLPSSQPVPKHWLKQIGPLVAVILLENKFLNLLVPIYQLQSSTVDQVQVIHFFVDIFHTFTTFMLEPLVLRALNRAWDRLPSDNLSLLGPVFEPFRARFHEASYAYRQYKKSKHRLCSYGPRLITSSTSNAAFATMFATAVVLVKEITGCKIILTSVKQSLCMRKVGLLPHYMSHFISHHLVNQLLWTEDRYANDYINWHVHNALRSQWSQQIRASRPRQPVGNLLYIDYRRSGGTWPRVKLMTLEYFIQVADHDHTITLSSFPPESVVGHAVVPSFRALYRCFTLVLR